jgi:hypothetical protein
MAATPRGQARAAFASGFSRRADRILPAYYVHLLVLFLVSCTAAGLEFWRYNAVYVLENLSAHVFLVATSHTSPARRSRSTDRSGRSLEAQFTSCSAAGAAFARAMARGALRDRSLVYAAAHHMDGLVAWMQAIEPSELSELNVRTCSTQFPAYLAHFAMGMLAA